jgi:hypothetical protein
LGSADYERPEERERVDESITFNEVGSASVLAHRPWRKQIPEFLTEDVELLVHDSRLTPETVAPADPEESLGDNEWAFHTIRADWIRHALEQKSERRWKIEMNGVDVPDAYTAAAGVPFVSTSCRLDS